MASEENIKQKRMVSGIQPTGDIHIGNYLGAIRQWAQFQQDYESIFFIADLHAITVSQDPKQLNSDIRKTAAILIAAGIDPAKSLLFVQSRVRAHTELAWILSCIIPMGWMLRMTQFKEKSSTQKEHVSVGLFDYPALMAADILLYDTDFVPVGEDQRQHLELTRDIAKRFNALYGKTFAIPDPLFPETSIRIMGLDDPFKKMSKTITEAGHAIHILDPPDDIYSKVQNARTDSLHEINFENAGAGVRNLLTIYKLFSGFDDSEIKNHFSGKGYMFLKKELADLIIENLRPIQKRFTGLLMDMASIDILLEKSAGKLIPVAETKLKMVRDKIGIG